MENPCPLTCKQCVNGCAWYYNEKENCGLMVLLADIAEKLGDIDRRLLDISRD